MKKLQPGAIAIASFLCLGAAADAAEYFIYKGADGRLVLTNAKPPTTAKAVVTYELTEATADEIAATEKANQETARLNALADLAEKTAQLADAVDAQRLRTQPIFIEWNQAAVSERRRFRHRE
jgi:Domain of unknown function (DUF4124)